MQTKLRGGLAKIGQETDSNCQTCGVYQDGCHLVLDCLETEDLRILLRTKIAPRTKWEFFEIMSDTKLVDIIADYIISNNIEI